MMKKNILVFTTLFFINISSLRGDVVEDALRECSDFNNICEVMSCRMSPLSAEALRSLQENFDQLERDILNVVEQERSNRRDQILGEFNDLRKAYDKRKWYAYFFDFIPSFSKNKDIQKLEKELLDLEKILNANPRAKRAIDEITIVGERLRHLKAGIYPRGVITIPGGSFRMGWNNDTLVTLRPFIAAQTHVTQGEWKQLSGGINPSHFRGDRRPVENLTWASMVMYTIKLNERLGLEQPVDISQMDPGKFTGKWENGTLNFKDESSKIIMDLKKKGYRAPTEAEWEYILKNLGKFTGKYPHSLKEENLGDYVVYKSNSNNQTAEVRSKKAFMIEDRGIYDAAGNVWIWTLDSYQEKLLGGDNPLQVSGANRIIRGGSWSYNVEFVRFRIKKEFGYRTGDVGFRVVRTY